VDSLEHPVVEPSIPKSDLVSRWITELGGAQMSSGWLVVNAGGTLKRVLFARFIK
jgi:hypothetical protein